MNPIKHTAQLFDTILASYDQEETSWLIDQIIDHLYDIYDQSFANSLITDAQFKHLCDGTSQIKNQDRLKQLAEFNHQLQNRLQQAPHLQQTVQQQLQSIIDFQHCQLSLRFDNLKFNTKQIEITLDLPDFNNLQISYPILHADQIKNQFDPDTSMFNGFVENLQFDTFRSSINQLDHDCQKLNQFKHLIQNVETAINKIQNEPSLQHDLLQLYQTGQLITIPDPIL